MIEHLKSKVFLVALLCAVAVATAVTFAEWQFGYSGWPGTPIGWAVVMLSSAAFGVTASRLSRKKR